jgi:predicted  nucleic acid-binding Zn-ribbon protein
MAIQQQQIDSYLGPETFKTWALLERRSSTERIRFEQSKRFLMSDAMSVLRLQALDDVDLVMTVGRDCRRGLDLVGMNQKIDKDTALDLLELYGAAVDVLAQENEMFRGMFAIGIFTQLVTFPFAILTTRAEGMLKNLKLLKEELSRTEIQTRKAQVKLALHGALTVCEVLTPELTMLARAEVCITDELIEYFLGPDAPTLTERVKTVSIPVTKLLSEAVEEVKNFGAVAHNVAKQTGRLATAATIYYDVQEIAEEAERASQIKERLEDLRTAHADLKEFLTQYTYKLRQFEHQLARWELNMTAAGAVLADARDTLDEDIKHLRYNTSGQMAWPLRP